MTTEGQPTGEKSMAEYNGYPSWESWNVFTWLNGDETLYQLARDKVKKHGIARAAEILAEELDGQSTPDGARYTQRSIYLAMQDMG